MRNIFKDLLSCRPSTRGRPLLFDLTCHEGNALSVPCVSNVEMNDKTQCTSPKEGRPTSKFIRQFHSTLVDEKERCILKAPNTVRLLEQLGMCYSQACLFILLFTLRN